MRARHPVFHEPTNHQVPVWRYLDFSKYVAMLSTRALYFARADKLGDPFEGSTTHLTRSMRDAQLAEYYPPDVIAKLSVGSSEFREWVRQWIFVNCWHMNECESAAMWRLYVRTSDAVTVQSTYARLAGCLPEHVLIGEVRYVDYDRSIIPETNLLFALMHKRRSFEHERELRAVWMGLPKEESAVLARVPNPENGRYVPVDLGQLVERVLVAPTAPLWFRDAVQSVTEHYGCGVPVSQSALDAKPHCSDIYAPATPSARASPADSQGSTPNAPRRSTHNSSRRRRPLRRGGPRAASRG